MFILTAESKIIFQKLKQKILFFSHIEIFLILAVLLVKFKSDDDKQVSY